MYDTVHKGNCGLKYGNVILLSGEYRVCQCSELLETWNHRSLSSTRGRMDYPLRLLLRTMPSYPLLTCSLLLFMQMWWCSGSTETIHCCRVNTQVQIGEERRLLSFSVSIIIYWRNLRNWSNLNPHQTLRKQLHHSALVTSSRLYVGSMLENRHSASMYQVTNVYTSTQWYMHTDPI